MDSQHCLTIKIKKGSGKPDVLTCIRSDGTATWQHLNPAFPIHDLCHYAVESILQLRNGFYGLVAQGWNITDFAVPWPKGRLPAEAEWTETVVGIFWMAYATHQELTLEECNRQLEDQLARSSTERTLCDASDKGLLKRRITADEFIQIRGLIVDLAGEWFGLPAGDTMTLKFEVGRDVPVPS